MPLSGLGLAGVWLVFDAVYATHLGKAVSMGAQWIGTSIPSALSCLWPPRMLAGDWVDTHRVNHLDALNACIGLGPGAMWMWVAMLIGVALHLRWACCLAFSVHSLVRSTPPLSGYGCAVGVLMSALVYTELCLSICAYKRVSIFVLACIGIPIVYTVLA